MGDHFGAEPGTQVYWAWAIPLWVGTVSTEQKLVGVNRRIAWYTSSSRVHVMNRNWSATKQRLRPQSVAEISRHSVLSGYPWSHSVGWCLAGRLACSDQRRHTGSGGALDLFVTMCDTNLRLLYNCVFCFVKFVQRHTTVNGLVVFIPRCCQAWFIYHGHHLYGGLA